MYGLNKDFVSLDTLGAAGDGEMSAAMQLFDLELQRALENCLDPNTKATTKREVVLKVTIKPDEDREACAVTIAATSKLAAVNPFPTQIFLGRRNGRVVAVEHNPKQLRVFDQIAEEKVKLEQEQEQAQQNTNVVSMERKVGE